MAYKTSSDGRRARFKFKKKDFSNLDGHNGIMERMLPYEETFQGYLMNQGLEYDGPRIREWSIPFKRYDFKDENGNVISFRAPFWKRFTLDIKIEKGDVRLEDVLNLDKLERFIVG